MEVLVKPEILPDDDEKLYEAYGCEFGCGCYPARRTNAGEDVEDDILF